MTDKLTITSVGALVAINYRCANPNTGSLFYFFEGVNALNTKIKKCSF